MVRKSCGYGRRRGRRIPCQVFQIDQDAVVGNGIPLSETNDHKTSCTTFDDHPNVISKLAVSSHTPLLQHLADVETTTLASLSGCIRTFVDTRARFSPAHALAITLCRVLGCRKVERRAQRCRTCPNGGQLQSFHSTRPIELTQWLRRCRPGPRRRLV